MKISKSMRIEESLIEKIVNCRTNSDFTKNLEYVLDDYFNTIKSREKEVKSLDTKLENTRKEYKKLENEINVKKNEFDSFMNALKFSRW